MHTSVLPVKIYPWRIATERGCLNGTLSQATLSRLLTAVDEVGGDVVIALTSGIDAQGVCFIRGTVHTEVRLTCQRCLEPLSVPLNLTVSLGLVSDEAAIDRLPEEYDPLLVAEGGSLTLAELVEDELLLALPLIPRHTDVRECVPPDAPPSRHGGADRNSHPFALLASLLQTSRRSH